MRVSYYDWSAYHARQRPGELAIIDLATGRRLTHHDLNDRAARLASWLQANGVGEGDRVAILSPNCPEYFELEFAGGKIGTIMVPLNWRLAEPELDFILKDCAPKVLIYDAAFRDMATRLMADCDIAHGLELDIDNPATNYEQAIASGGSSPEIADLGHEDLSMIMYTSGTTGRPKGAMISHAMNFYNAVNIGMPSGCSPDTVQLVVLPLFHTGGMNCYANPVLHAGGCVVLMREFEPGGALAALGDTDLGVTHFFAVPAPYQFMMQHPDFASTDLSRLEVAGVGGAPCAEPILKGWIGRGVPLVQGWGMTETGPTGTLLAAADAERKLGSAGQPVLHAEIRIVDDQGHDLPHGEKGELIIRGPSVTPGYWNKPDATADAFMDGWLKTGDAAYMDDEGFIFIVDRWKDMYISGGENVYPAEVENILYELPQIAEAAIIGVPDDRWGETGMAIIALKPGEELSEQAVIEHCLKNLAKFKVPASVVWVDALPRNATGKVLKWELRTTHLGDDAPAIS